MNVSQCFIKLLYTDSSRPIPPLHRSQHENYENTFWILGTEWTHQKKCWELCLRLSGMSARRPCVCLHFIDQNCGRKTFRKTLRALANNRETEALASVIFFVFVVYSQHKHPKYLGRKIKPWTLPFISIFSWTLTCLSHNKYFFLTTVLILIIATVSRHWEFLRMKTQARCAAFIVRHFQFQISDCQVQEE